MPRISDTRIYLEIEKLRINREKSRLVLDKSMSLYGIFMLIALLGFIFDYIDSFMLNTLVILGIVILITGTMPYMIHVHKEEKQINEYLGKLK
jgi:hypothetical protein